MHTSLLELLLLSIISTMSDPLFYLKKFIKESIISTEEDFCRKFDAHRGYYDIDPHQPLSIEDVIDGWAKCGLKARELDVFHAFYPADDLWKYREYTWSAESASLEDVTGTDGATYPDKWRFVPDEDDHVGIDKWNKMVEKLKTKGWSSKQPAYFEIGKNGIAKVGEGNHRLAIAKQLGISVPVLFAFKSNVSLSSASNVR
jgi:hypothetical protein